MAPGLDIAAQVADPHAADVRSTLEMLLGHHATLTVRFLRAKLDADPAFVQTAVDALDGNTRDLAAAVESLKGPEAAAAFERLWVDHVRLLFSYTDAVANDDEPARRRAVQALDRYRADLGELLTSATDGRLEEKAISAALETHIEHLLAQAEAHAAGDYETSYALQREAYAHMFAMGRALSAAFTGDSEAAEASHDPAADLRSALGMLLGEHVELAVDAMRAGVRGAPEFEHAAAALNANTQDLAAAVDGVFGARDARRFNQVWGEHIDLFVEYTVALAEEDEAAQDRISARLEPAVAELGAFFSDATDGELNAEAAIRHLQPHDNQLLEQIQAYAAEDYERAFDLSYDAYQHMFATAARLAEGIQGQLATQLPEGGADTGGGGAHAHGQ